MQEQRAPRVAWLDLSESHHRMHRLLQFHMMLGLGSLFDGHKRTAAK